LGRAFDLASDRLPHSLDDLLALLRIPSVSAVSDHAADTRRAAELVAQYLGGAGLENVHLAHPKSGHAVVRVDWLGAPGKPTLLMYGHYDVQPPDPFDEWTSPPFEPEIRAGRIYARGASDNKGQLMALIKGVEALMEAEGGLPVNVKFAIEGEEEISGRTLHDYLRDNRDDLAGDAVLVADSSFPHPDVPGILTGLRGLVYVEVEATGAAFDLHSGQYGGVAPNPLNALAWIIAGLKAPQGQIMIPGFYDRVRPAGLEETRSWERLQMDEDELLQTQIGSDDFFGEPGYSVTERMMARPTLDVHGVRGGFTGEGTKTVIPARATAKISMRLVPDQDPDDVYQALEARVMELVTRGTRVQVRLLNADPPVVCPIDGRGVAACQRALRRGFGKEPAFYRIGASIPVCSAFQQTLGVELVVTGFGLPDDRLHSPNEKYDITQYEGGIKTAVAMLEEYGTAASG